MGGEILVWFWTRTRSMFGVIKFITNRIYFYIVLVSCISSSILRLGIHAS